ncbi:uncharacterized protein LOC6578183 [Drosophila mojavensis]|uniref:Uncharacterized protein n=1 Tax=Drosophila mojavensis TaxID=7230 RepID=B4KJG2_DROMO|nr:uncharacterized protein LOC6578183 [Drosophila mojavensis]EDW13542.1 uncharacterized protein Dmoj_GI19435 [Drosophila mojavensis]
MESHTGKTSELSGAELRREARRRKILESAKARLEKLNGGVKLVETNNTDCTARDYSDPEVEPNVPIGVGLSQEELVFSTTRFSSSSNRETQNKFIKCRVHIFIASILGYILSCYVSNSLFIPVFLCIMIEIFYLNKQQQIQNNIVSMILPITVLFTGEFIGNRIKQANRFIYILQYLIINLAVNIFCICISSYVCKFRISDHVTDIK